VKWKNSKDEDWIPLSTFNSMEIISEFNKSKALESSENLENITKTADKEFSEKNLEIPKNKNAKQVRITKTRLKRKQSNEPNKNNKKAKLADNNNENMNSLNKNLGTRKSPRLNNPNINSLFTILAIIMKITFIFGLEIKSDFNYCDNSEKKIVI
jgi:hypothetical protein